MADLLPKFLLPLLTLVLVLLSLTLLGTVPHPRVIQIREMLSESLQLSHLPYVVQRTLQNPLQYVIGRQKEEIVHLQRNCPMFGMENMFLTDLSEFDDILLETDSHKLMFFLETSGKPGLTIRQGCAVESAEGRSGRSVILLMTSATVDVCSDKLLQVLHLPNLLVAHLNHSLLVNTTPLQPMFDDGRVKRSCCSMIHMSDIFRMAVLYRYGGWYSDMDTITVAKTDHLENVVASSGDFVANGNLMFNAKNGFLHKLMIQAEMKFTSLGWNSLGPVLLTETLLDFCHVGRKTGRPLIAHHRTCWNVTVLNYPSFYPIKANQRALLFDNHPDLHWKREFMNSYSVHFFGQITSGRGWATGNYTAYDYLGKRFCPATYSVQNNMELWL